MAEKRKSDNEYGYIHNLSPVKKSKNNCEWYDFQIQTSPVKTSRVVGFNISSHSKLKDFETSKTAILLQNVKSSKGDIIFNQQSSLCAAANSDVSFDYVEQEKPQLNNAGGNGLSKTVDVTVAEIKTLKANQKVNLQAVITIGTEKPKQVTLTKSQEVAQVKEDCVMEDPSGSIMAHIWSPFIDKLKSGQAYRFTNLAIRNFQGSIFLSSSPSSEATASSLTMENLAGPNMLVTPTKEVECTNFKLVSKLSVYSLCALCHKRLNDVTLANSVKCHHCGTRQRTRDIKRDASVRLCIEGGDQATLWLTAYTENIVKLLTPQNVNLMNSTHDIEEALMNVENVLLTYNAQSEIIKDVRFQKPSPQ